MRREHLHSLSRLALAAAAVLGFALAVLAAAGAPPFQALAHIVKGSIGSWAKFAQVIKVWIPLTLCSCGLLFTFRIGLWNIGIEGQVTAGAICSVAVLRMAVERPELAPLSLPASLAAAMLGASLWAALAGFLKTKGGVNEIFAGLGLNFVAQGLVLWLIFGPWKQPGVASMSGTETLPEMLRLSLPAGWRIPPAALFITAAAFIATGWSLYATKIGLHLKAAGSNAQAANLFGLSPDRLILIAMLAAGGAAGLAGNFQVTAVYHRLIPSISSNYGYLSLLVVMLADYRIGWIAPVALFFAALSVGSIQLPMMLQLDSSLSGVIQGALVLAALGMGGWRRRKADGRQAAEGGWKSS